MKRNLALTFILVLLLASCGENINQNTAANISAARIRDAIQEAVDEAQSDSEDEIVEEEFDEDSSASDSSDNSESDSSEAEESDSSENSESSESEEDTAADEDISSDESETDTAETNSDSSESSSSTNSSSTNSSSTNSTSNSAISEESSDNEEVNEESDQAESSEVQKTTNYNSEPVVSEDTKTAIVDNIMNIFDSGAILYTFVISNSDGCSADAYLNLAIPTVDGLATVATTMNLYKYYMVKAFVLPEIAANINSITDTCLVSAYTASDIEAKLQMKQLFKADVQKLYVESGKTIYDVPVSCDAIEELAIATGSSSDEASVTKQLCLTQYTKALTAIEDADPRTENTNPACNDNPSYENCTNALPPTSFYLDEAQRVIDPEAQVVKDLIAESGTGMEAIFDLAQRVHYMGDPQIYACMDKWVTPTELLTATPEIWSNPYCPGADLENAIGDCEDKSTLLISLLISSGLYNADTARLAGGSIIIGGQHYGHVWVEVWDGSKWEALDATTPTSLSYDYFWGPDREFNIGYYWGYASPEHKCSIPYGAEGPATCDEGTPDYWQQNLYSN